MPQTIGATSALLALSGFGPVAAPIKVSSAASVSLVSLVVLAAFLNVLLFEGFGSTLQLATANRQRNADCRELGAISEEVYRVIDEHDELCSALKALCDSFQVPHAHMLGFRSKLNLIFA